METINIEMTTEFGLTVALGLKTMAQYKIVQATEEESTDKYQVALKFFKLSMDYLNLYLSKVEEIEHVFDAPEMALMLECITKDISLDMLFTQYHEIVGK